MVRTTKLNNIQVLRAFAAIAVVLFHTGFVFPHMRSFGSFGVDVFFVISGYIMARILDPQSDSSSDFFLRRRVLRIVPPYWFFTLLLFVAAFKIPQLMGATRASGLDLFKSLFFIPFPKYPGVIQPLLFIGWSLNYEMFFYVMLAIGLVLHQALSGYPLGRKIDAVWFGSALVLITNLACLPYAGSSDLASFYSRDLVLEFLLGVLSYYLCRSIPDHLFKSLRIPGLLICLGSALLLILIQGDQLNFGPRIVALGIPSFFLVTTASLLSQSGWDTRLAWLVLIGDASYILYLIHPYCEYSIERVLSPRLPWLHLNTVSGAVIGVSLSILLALLIHVYCERPTVRFLNRRFGGRRKSLEFSTPVLP